MKTLQIITVAALLCTSSVHAVDWMSPTDSYSTYSSAPAYNSRAPSTYSQSYGTRSTYDTRPDISPTANRWMQPTTPKLTPSYSW